MDNAIVTRDLSKRYRVPKGRGWRTALEGLSLTVPEGMIFGFLGPNGAGKTTTIKMFLDFISPTSGEAFLFGTPVASSKSREPVGFLPEQPYFYKFLTPYEVLKMHGEILGMQRKGLKTQIEENLERVGITEYRDLPLSKISKGNIQRVGLAQSMMGSPRLLILDEPGSGLDPVGRRAMRNLLAGLRKEGRTIFLSSHLLSEIESLCDRIAVLARGRLVAEGKPEEIVHTTTRTGLAVNRLDPHQAGTFLTLGGKIEDRGSESIIDLPSENLLTAIRLLEQNGGELISVAPIRETLEEAFLRLVGSPSQDIDHEAPSFPRAA